VSCGRAGSADHAVRGDQQGEPGQAEEPGEDNVGEPVVAEEDPAEPHRRCPGDGQDAHTAMPRRLLSRLATR
jgi:hypothetical protein